MATQRVLSYLADVKTASVRDPQRLRKRFMAIPIWVALLSLGLAVVLVQPLVSAPLAEQARIALGRLQSDHPGAVGTNIVVLAAYALLLVLIPMLFLLGCVAIEKWATKHRTPRAHDPLIWQVQLLFAALMVAAWSFIGLIRPLPEALHSIALESGSLLDRLKLALLYILGLILADILFYWVHRAQHRFAWLWRFHAVHHSQDDLDVLHAVTHPVESFTRLLVITVPIGVLVSFDVISICVLASLMAIQTKLTHLRAPIHFGVLGKVIADNRFHFIHHSRDPADYNCNFADRFPFIDRLFGTYREPRPLLPETGLGDRGPPATLRQYLLAICPEHRRQYRA